MPSGNRTHACLRSTYTVTVGAGNVGSAKAPTGIVTKPGMASARQNTVAPHEGQKWKCAVVPSSPVRANCVLSPSTVVASSENRAYTPNALPVRCWQHRQWQIDTRTGSPRAVMRNFPQLHEATRSVMASVPARPHRR